MIVYHRVYQNVSVCVVCACVRMDCRELFKENCFVHADEENHGVWNSGARWSGEEVEGDKEIELSTQIKLVRYGVARYKELPLLEYV